MEEKYKIKAKTLTNYECVIDLCDTEEQFKSMTVLQLMEKIAEKVYISDMRLVFTGKILNDYSRLLCECGVSHMSTIHVTSWLRGGGGWPRPPDRGDGGMGDKDGQNRSMESLSDFNRPGSID